VNIPDVRLTTLLFVLAACSAEPVRGGLVGEWETPDGEMTLELLEDGTFETTGPGGTTRGRYQPVEEGVLRMDFDTLSTTAAYSVSDEALVLCPEGHHCERFERAD
jgi:hypothetical protein